jgi:OOP family OmpA-OmpF porin
MRFFKFYFVSFNLLFQMFLWGQTSDRPWSLSAYSNIINLVEDNTEKGSNFGGPALSLSRSIAGGLSIGSQISFGKVYNFNTTLDYTSLDGFLKFNLANSKSFQPYLISGYGFSLFSEGQDKPGFFPSTETSRTYFGGLGFQFPMSDHFSLSVQSTYRQMNENDGFDHLQHFLGLNYNFGGSDRDKDGVPDKKDECPDTPGLKEYKGCPDTDGDTIIDKEDKCPEVFGSPEFQGCKDSDGDGIPDPDDLCPEIAGSTEFEGCPDTDGDGIPDPKDECISEKGPIENKGCPWPDKDQDGVPDHEDLCPDENGTLENKGCPELSQEIVKTLNEYGSKIFFPANSTQIIGKKTREVLDQIKTLLDENPNGAIVIEGYSSSDGPETYNQALSIKRAEAVLQYLIGLGVPADRLEVEGYGESNPLGDNSEAEGRAINRRVQFKPKRN